MPHATMMHTWVLQAATAVHDTVYMRQVGSAPTVFEKVTSIASGLLTLAILALALALVPAALNFRKAYHRIAKLLERTQGDIQPLLHHASAIADNVEFITTSVRADVQRVHATVTMANERLQRAIEEAEAKVAEFNAVLGVVQEEAEGAFVSAAAAVRGVRAGAASFRRTDGPEFASEEDAVPDDMLPELSDEEAIDGGSSETDRAEAPFRPQPRIRPRRRG